MVKNHKDKKLSWREFELVGAAGLSVAALTIVIFVATSLDKYLIGTAQYASVMAAVLVDMANNDRNVNNVSTLTLNPLLVAAAQAKANDMAAKSYFAHISPEGVDPWHWFEEAGYRYKYAGENLAVDFSDSTDVNNAWMNSRTHRENILDPHFTEIGIAVAQGFYEGRSTTFVVQEFGLPAEASAKAGAPTHEITPQNPAEPALATTATGTVVLGASTQPADQLAPAPLTGKEVSQKDVLAASPSPATVLDSTAGQPQSAQSGVQSAPAPRYASFWAHMFGSPRSLLQYAYYFVALLLAAIFALATGLELRWHHRGKAIAAGALFVLMGTLFATADNFIFTRPTVDPSAITASAAEAF
ncbi:CAP domain-containing protein [Candidatus Kaiserbacteria bacterium]|nr:CAP domain-containing protein [Candidatus Kaiserbacteria bacterium]